LSEFSVVFLHVGAIMVAIPDNHSSMFHYESQHLHLSVKLGMHKLCQFKQLTNVPQLVKSFPKLSL